MKSSARLAGSLMCVLLAWAQDDRPRLRPLTQGSASFKTGPAVGSHIPAFEVFDSKGRRRTFDSLKGPKGLVLTFTRSVDWCAYCKMQLADLNQQAAAFRIRGLGVASLTYDSREILRDFSGRLGIKYTMLSDPDSKVIRAFNILNTDEEPTSAYYGVPYPGTYVIDERGVVTAKYFDDDYRERISSASILTHQFGADGTMKETVENAQLKLTSSASESELVPGGRTTLILDIEPKPGMHVYAPEVRGYTPINWQIADSKAWVSFPVTYPASHLLDVPVIKETVPVYDSRIRLIRDLAIGLDLEIGPVINLDRTLTIDGSFKYQACDDKECYVPKIIPLKWTFKVGFLDNERVPYPLQKKGTQ